MENIETHGAINAPVFPAKLTVGQKGRIIQDTTCHLYPTGQIVTVNFVNEKAYDCTDDNNRSRGVYFADLEPISAEEPISQIPKYFVVKRDNTPEWNEYIKWLNKTYGVFWDGDADAYYGFDGKCDGKYVIKEFKNNPQVFTAQEFMKIINNKPMKLVTDLTKKQAINCPTKEEARAISNLINKPKEHETWKDSNWCVSPNYGWSWCDLKYYQEKEYEIFPAKDFLPPSFYTKTQQNMKRILKLNDYRRIQNSISPSCEWYNRVKNQFVDFAIKDELEVPEELYKEARRAANTAQNTLLDEIFGKDVKEIDYNRVKSSISIRTGGNYEKKSLYLCYQEGDVTLDGKHLKYRLETDDKGFQVLIAEYR